MHNYVAGFLFDNGQVALIQKNKPEWQKYKLNGIGGKIELGETPHEAMVREFYEETGCRIDQWRVFAKLRGSDWKVYFFSAEGDHKLCSSITDEQVKFCLVDRLYDYPLIPNLHWLIPLALDSDKPVADVIQ
jgi:8-oxo-dGTP diphosphatase